MGEECEPWQVGWYISDSVIEGDGPSPTGSLVKEARAAVKNMTLLSVRNLMCVWGGDGGGERPLANFEINGPVTDISCCINTHTHTSTHAYIHEHIGVHTSLNIHTDIHVCAISWVITTKIVTNDIITKYK